MIKKGQILPSSGDKTENNSPSLLKGNYYLGIFLVTGLLRASQ